MARCRVWLVLTVISSGMAVGAADDLLAEQLQAPILFVKRLNYVGLHIYDTYYKWRPGGGIYILENPADPPDERRIRPLIDATTPGTLGGGIYSNPELSWDATRVLFSFKPSQDGSTSIYEIGVDGSGLRRVSDPEPFCGTYKGSHGGHHDISPAYLPDGRITFTTTRPSGLVPCANVGVDILHTMNADGSDMRSISVNNVNEFDPSILPDGRILFGRWEYVDKTALTQQSLWTVFPDGTNETALYANNMVHPEAVLDARPVPGAPHLIVATFTPHNSPPRGTIAFIDTRLGKNDLAAITNLEYPDNPAFDRGESCEPWALSENTVLYSGRPEGGSLNAIMMIDRQGHREVIYADPEIDCHSPMLIQARPVPTTLVSMTDLTQRTGRFFVQDIYQGLTGVAPGEVKWLRVIEETSRVSATPGGAFNQTFLLSAILAFTVKDFLGIVPVETDGSVLFEAPAGRALYLQALDADGRLVQSMRTFVQAAPGVTRSCIGCHEHKYSAAEAKGQRLAASRVPERLRDESWGSGFVDFPSMVQPILDRRCVSCHGGDRGIAGGLDLSGGWTEYFSISYENLVSRRETQLTAHLIAGIDCMNGTSRWSAKILPPRAHGSGSAPLAALLVHGHKGRIPDLTRSERDLLMAWIDTNGLYHGTWDYSAHGCSISSWGSTRNALVEQMRAAGCMQCHGNEQRLPLVFEDDWINLEHPEMSRILRAPLAPGGDAHGLGFCRDRKVDPARQRTSFLRTGAYVHGDLPLESFAPEPFAPPDRSGDPVITFASAADPTYQTMLGIIQQGRRQALATPRVDMPGAEVIAGECRTFLPPPLPDPLPELRVTVDHDAIVHLSWERSAATIGLQAELHRGKTADFTPAPETMLTVTPLFAYVDRTADTGGVEYALVLQSGGDRSAPIRRHVEVPVSTPPPPVEGLEATPGPGRIDLHWDDPDEARGLGFNLYRASAGNDDWRKLNDDAMTMLSFSDLDTAPEQPYRYLVKGVTRRGIEGPPSVAITSTPLPEIREAVFVADFAGAVTGTLHDGSALPGSQHGQVGLPGGGLLDLTGGGFVTFPHHREFDLTQRLSIACWVKFEAPSPMPVIVSCGAWQQTGWFLQRIGAGWRWHVAGLNCDGGKAVFEQWTHLLVTYDGDTARLYQDGELAAEVAGPINRGVWVGPLHVGQYSGAPGPDYQVFGKLADLKVYNRAATAEDAAAWAKTPPTTPGT